MHLNQSRSGRLSKTCNQCRARKVRCGGDGTRSICANCSRLGFACSFQLPENSSVAGLARPSTASLQPERVRVRQACLSCHSQKARCSGDTPSCRRCQDKKIRCVYRPKKRSAGEATLGDEGALSSSEASNRISPYNPFDHGTELSPRSLQSERTGPPPREVVLKALESFFKNIYPLPAYAFLHKASLFQKYNAGEADPSLLLAIIGITSYMVEAENNMREYGCTCVENAASSILLDLDRPSVAKLQALVLIIRHRMAQRRFNSAFVLLSIVSRFAFALRLNYESPNLCFLAQESRRRLMWAIFMLDTTFSAGLNEFTTCPGEVVHLQLPGREEDFELDISRDTAPLIQQSGDEPELSLLAYYIRIMSLRDRILRYTKSVASSNEGAPEVPQAVKSLEERLKSFASSLPSSATFSEKNLSLRAYSPQLPRFVMLHIWLHQCFCDLFRFLTLGFRESVSRQMLQQIDPDFVSYCQIQCYEHARSIADILSSFLALQADFPLMDTDIAVCAYQTTRIIFNAFQTDPEKFNLNPGTVTEVAETCLSLIKKLSSSSSIIPSIQMDIENLITRGFSSPSSGNRSVSPEDSETRDQEPISAAASSKQLLSRHSLIKNSTFVDDSSELAMHGNSSRNALHHRRTQEQSEPSTTPNSTSDIGSFNQNFMYPNPSQYQQANIPTLRTEPIPTPSTDLDVHDAYQGLWENLPHRLDPISQMQDDWGAFNSFQSGYWDHGFGDGS